MAIQRRLAVNECVIKEAVCDDVSALSALGKQTFIEKFGHLYNARDLNTFLESAHSPNYYAAAISTPGTQFWMATAKTGEAIGYAMAGKMSLPIDDAPADALEIKRLYIATPYQSKGMGAGFMSTMFDWVRGQGNPVLYLGVYSENFGAQRFYRRYGFRQVGAYEFPVGNHLDLEYILRRAPEIMPGTQK